MPVGHRQVPAAEVVAKEARNADDDPVEVLLLGHHVDHVRQRASVEQDSADGRERARRNHPDQRATTRPHAEEQERREQPRRQLHRDRADDRRTRAAGRVAHREVDGQREE